MTNSFIKPVLSKAFVSQIFPIDARVFVRNIAFLRLFLWMLLILFLFGGLLPIASSAAKFCKRHLLVVPIEALIVRVLRVGVWTRVVILLKWSVGLKLSRMLPILSERWSAENLRKLLEISHEVLVVESLVILIVVVLGILGIVISLLHV
jgi:hypothetical protein